MYIRPWPTQVEAHSLRRPWVTQLRMALDPTSEPTPWCVPAQITSATSGDKLPFTVVRLALSLVQYGRTLRLWPGQIRLRAIGVKWDHVPLSLYLYLYLILSYPYL